MRNLSARSRIILLVVLAALPALALIVYSTFDERARADRHSRDEAARLAGLIAQRQAQVLEGAVHSLHGVSAVLPAVRGDRQRCNLQLAQLLKAMAHTYTAVAVVRLDGSLACGAGLPPTARVPGDEPLIRIAAAASAPVVGKFENTAEAPFQGLALALAIRTESAPVSEVAVAVVDAARFDVMADPSPLPDGSVFIAIDADGTMLARHPHALGAVGQKLPDPLAPAATGQANRGILVPKAIDGSERLYAYDTAWRNPDGTAAIRVVVGVPLAGSRADINGALVRNIGGVLVATLLLVIAGWFGAEVFILRNIRKLLAATRRVRAGRLGARTGLAYGRDELAQLGSAFDEMTDALRVRETELKQAMHELRQQAITDALTGLYNRRYLYDALPRELSRGRRTRHCTGILMIDIDHFKRVNDSYGHEAGDLVLKALAGLMKTTVRSSDYCCRYGGEELALILPDTTGEGAQMRAEAIRIAVQSLEIMVPGGQTISVTVSIGVAVHPDHGDDTDALLRAADEALYQAKGAGRNRVVVQTRVSNVAAAAGGA